MTQMSLVMFSPVVSWCRMVLDGVGEDGLRTGLRVHVLRADDVWCVATPGLCEGVWCLVTGEDD